MINDELLCVDGLGGGGAGGGGVLHGSFTTLPALLPPPPPPHLLPSSSLSVKNTGRDDGNFYFRCQELDFEIFRN